MTTLTTVTRTGLHTEALDHVFTIGASGSSAYTFQGEGLNGTVNNPTLYLTRGKTYRFENGSGGHPIRIQSTSGASGTAYNTGVTNNAGSGTVIVEVQHDAPDVLYYQCTSHAAMNGILYITGALADGGVTTAKIADDAVNNDKLANSVVASIAANTAKTTNATHTGDVTGSTSLTIASGAVTASKIADNAVQEAKINNGAVTVHKIGTGAVNSSKIADATIGLDKLVHGTSSNDGKFLRANNGADPSFETVTSTTINNNADDRVITGSGTANTLNAESGLTYNGSTKLSLIGSGQQILNIGSTDAGGAAILLDGDSNGDGSGGDYSIIRQFTNGDLEFFARNPSGATNTIFKQGTSEAMRISDAGRVGIGKTPSSTLDIETASNANGFNINCIGTPANYFLNVRDDNVSKFYISSNGEVGINNDSPASYGANGHGYAGLTVQTPSGSYSGITIKSAYNGAGILAFADGSGSNAERMNGFVSCDHVNKRLNIGLDGNTVARFTTHGFHPNPSDSASNTALDDYEEGVYNPTMKSGCTLYSNEDTLSYTKIGRAVFVTGRIRINSDSYSGGLTMTLPFTATTSTDCSNCGQSFVATHGVHFDLNSDSNYTNTDLGTLTAETITNTAYVNFLIPHENDSWIHADNHHIDSNVYLAINHHYIT